jgi:hypothetical protein
MNNSPVEAAVRTATLNFLSYLSLIPLSHRHTRHVRLGLCLLAPSCAYFSNHSRCQFPHLIPARNDSINMTANFIRLDSWEADMFHGAIPPHALARHCPLDNGRHTIAFDDSRAPSLGTLARLPMELQLQVILQLDFASLLVWIRANKRAMAFVWGLFE